jgi:hypothetical protein
VLARSRWVALAVAPVVLVAAAIGVVTGTADAHTASQSIARSQESQQCQSRAASQASCSFATEIQLPLSVSVSAQASPANGQDATVAWTVSCSVSGGSLASSSGTHTAATPFQTAISLPRSESGDCTVNVTTTVNGSGSLTAVLTYRLGVQVQLQVPTSHPVGDQPLFYFMCMRDSKQSHASGAQVVLGNCSSVYMGAWTYNGSTLVHGGLCLTDPRGGRTGTKLVLDKCTGAADQNWTYHPGQGQGGPFSLKSPRLCLHDPNYTKVINTPLTVYGCDGGPDEDWGLSA